ncbi:pyridoxal-dependent decarboxylase [Dothidotthia symphoricarpi CBS 119687]|uniref:Pyridoxal-dependent decarboxylase n=1 Tax=Dothidotthia symphoricarpi CBS 119687 TaxID=1392245 RepID=A0A6A6AFN9_9PLEO|nr:pyridoxal-dependent decarboxylase [Dothidotthia symphoricarpi CBS 119687]KAF2129925.1 pyridoxal-dependent decarboxylase [Dothidotthia symphoricarpi CBS 119687]
MKAEDPEIIKQLSAEITNLYSSHPPQDVLPSSSAITKAQQKLVPHLPTQGLGLTATIQHLHSDLTPAFNASSRSANYYGFVIGGSTPVATLADNLVTLYDQNVQVHLPNETITTNVEDRALALLCELINFEPGAWSHRTFTTGATASNVLGLACGREYILAEASAHRTDAENSVGEFGIVEAMRRAGIDEIQILTTVPHSSLAKAASILGMGRASVKSIGMADAPHKFDMQVLRKHLERPGAACIVAVSASEVNTGLFATSGLEEMQELRKLCDMYGAWIHVDGAFGIMGRVLDKPEYSAITQFCEGLELADSITGDGHKLLNVPYDCGFFLSRHRNIAERVFVNPNAAYLATSGGDDNIMSPLNIGLENSRRFRALPVYASLVAYGKAGYQDMLERQVKLARGIAKFIIQSEEFELLPEFEGEEDEVLSRVFIIVLFRAKDEGLNKVLVDRIKATRKIYVSGTSWDGKPACRFAVSNWQTEESRDLPIIEKALGDVLENWKKEG